MVNWVRIGEENLEGKYDETAFIRIPYEQFAERFEISFTPNARYGAGPAAVAIVELRSGTQFLLQHEYNHPQPGVWLFCRVDADAEKQRSEFAEAFGLDAADYRWIKRGERWLSTDTSQPVEPDRESTDALTNAVRTYVEAQDRSNSDDRTAALSTIVRLLEALVRERLDDRPLAASLDGLSVHRTAVSEDRTLEITGALYTLITRGGHTTNLMLPMHARLSPNSAASSIVKVADATSQFDLPKSEREFQRAFDRAAWRYSFTLGPA